jgi:hypothetical protein
MIHGDRVSLIITLFACPKPFRGQTDIIQRNAIESWTRLRPKPEIILLGTDVGLAEVCREFGLIHAKEIIRNEYGTPLVNSVFKVGQEKASYPVVCYINSDIILMSGFIRSVETVAARMPKFLILGQRQDINMDRHWNFDSDDWEEDMALLVARKGVLHPPNGIDFFCFPRGMYTEIPPFAIGRFAWDNWLVWQAWAKGVPIVDVTDAVAAIHQNHGYEARTIHKLDSQYVGAGKHGYSSRSIKKIDGIWVKLGPEVRQNIALVPDINNLNIWAATWRLDHKGRIGRRWLKLRLSYLYYQLICVVPLYWPRFGRLIRWMSSVKTTLIKGRF